MRNLVGQGLKCGCGNKNDKATSLLSSSSRNCCRPSRICSRVQDQGGSGLVAAEPEGLAVAAVWKMVTATAGGHGWWHEATTRSSSSPVTAWCGPGEQRL